MPTYTTTDPQTGLKIKLTGDSPPSESDIDQAFAAVRANGARGPWEDYKPQNGPWDDYKPGSRSLPPGYTLDKPSTALPPGYTLDAPTHTINVQAEDGSIHKFPVGTPPAMMQDAVNQYTALHKPGLGGTLIDMARSLPGGLAKGVAAIVGLPGDARELGDTVSRVALNYFDPGAGDRVGRMVDAARAANPLQLPQLPTSSAINSAISAPTGGYYVPKTTAGQYAETAASFAPAALGGEASLPATAMRVARNVIAPAVGSKFLGDLIPDSSDPVQHGLHIGASVGGAVLGAGGVAGLSSGIRAALSNPATPETVANQYLGSLLAKQGITNPGDIAANAVGRGQTAAEAIGPAGVNALQTLARRAPAIGESLGAHLTERATGTPERILSDYADASGINPEAAQGNIDALVEQGRATAKPLYDRALSTPGGVMTPDLASLLQRPIIKKAMASAANDIRNAGGDPSAIGLHFDEDGAMTATPTPTAQAWDLTKKALGNSVERDAFGNRLPDSKSPGNFSIGKANAALTSALVDGIPGYGDALAASGDYLSLQNAFQRGQAAILNPKVTVGQIADHVSGLSPSELDAYKGGVANKLFNMQQNGTLKPRAVLSPSVQGKLSAVLGPSNARNFIQNVLTEKQLAETGARMMPRANSATFELMQNAGDQDQLANTIAGLRGLRAIGHAVTGNIPAAVTNGLSAATHFFPNLLKTGGMSIDSMNAAGRALLGTPEDLAASLPRLPLATRPALAPLRLPYVGLLGGAIQSQQQQPAM